MSLSVVLGNRESRATDVRWKKIEILTGTVILRP